MNNHKSFIGILLFVTAFLCGCEEDLDFVFRNNFKTDLDKEAEYILVIGDIQDYTYDKNLAKNYLMSTNNWIRGMNQAGYKIDCVLQTGDITNNNMHWQYGYFYDTTKDLAQEILYVTCTGNHDYEWGNDSEIMDRRSSQLSYYCNFKHTVDAIEEYFEDGIMDNIVIRNTIRGERCDILVLEFGPRPEVVEWARKYVERHTDRKYILMTHEFLTGPLPGRKVPDGETYAERQFKNIPASTPKYIWDNLIYPNDNIRCVLCGHNGFSMHISEKNAAGRMVPQILFKLQNVENGGNGLIMVWQMPKNSDIIDVKVYNTVTNELYRDTSDEIFDWHNCEYQFHL